MDGVRSTPEQKPHWEKHSKMLFFNVSINLSCNYWSCIFNNSWPMKIKFTKTEFDVLVCRSYVIVTILWSFLFNNNNRFWFLLARDPPSCSFWIDDGSISGSHRTSSCVASRNDSQACHNKDFHVSDHLKLIYWCKIGIFWCSFSDTPEWDICLIFMTYVSGSDHVGKNI